MNLKPVVIRLAMPVLLSSLVGCASAPAARIDESDPWEGFNRSVQVFNDKLDEHVMEPLAKGYQWITPTFVDRGVTNFFSNINDIGVTINNFLQFKLAQTGSDGARFLVNTVAGVGGLFDVATEIDLPKNNEDFDQTLAVWGVPSGPFLVLPFFGPSSVRGVFGLVGDAAMNPISYIDGGIVSGTYGAIRGGLFVLNAVNTRADNLSTMRIATEAAVDRYEFFKNAYIQQREYLILDGNVPENDWNLDIDFNNFNGEYVEPNAI